MAKRLRMVENLANTARHRFGFQPLGESPLSLQGESVSEYEAQAIRNGVHTAGVRLMAVEDHLAAIAALVEEERVIYATYSVARVAAEISGWAWWLLDPNLDGSTRAARCITDRFYSLGQQRNIGFSKEARIEEARAEAEDAGVRLKKQGNTWRSLEKRPSSSDLMRQVYGNGEADSRLGSRTYSLLSAFSHGTAYALLEVITPLTSPDEKGRVWGRVNTQWGKEVRVIALAVQPYILAVQAQFRLHGWTDERLGIHLENLHKSLLRQM